MRLLLLSSSRTAGSGYLEGAKPALREFLGGRVRRLLMPICEPLGLDALGLVPFQINPHYLHGNPPGFHGETREERIREYLELHPEVTVVGLREGSMFQAEDGAIRLLGDQPCRVFRRGEDAREIAPGSPCEFLLR